MASRIHIRSGKDLHNHLLQFQRYRAMRGVGGNHAPALALSVALAAAGAMYLLASRRQTRQAAVGEATTLLRQVLAADDLQHRLHQLAAGVLRRSARPVEMRACTQREATA